ncbi:flavodoxin family protein [Lacrimispora sp.]|uniref:flavodoxin family protein n=1 Tax=Lacrimispora sp. TaxID=2719234 RepID=UPI0032E4F9A7
MKVVAINGSPRKGWNTEKLLKEALRGAESAGAETKLVQLYDLKYTGCKSCFGCKRKGMESCHCILKDELTSVLEEIFEADAVILGSPIYFGSLTGQMISFLERLKFPLLSYDDFSRQLFDGSINVAFFYTMNEPKENYKNVMEQSIQSHSQILQRLGGNVETYASCDTYQFNDYSKYHSGALNEAHKRKVRETQFPKDMEAAYEIGCKLMSK